MSHAIPTYATLDEWIKSGAIPFDLDAPGDFDAAVDGVMAAAGGAVEVLGLGEALHGGEEILLLRNRLFERLVEAHGYSAIAIESSFPRAHIVNEYVAGASGGGGPELYEAGFSHGFGRLEANRELVEWMRRYNADAAHAVKLRFYGFDTPTEMTVNDSPVQLLDFVLEYLAAHDGAAAQRHRERIEAHLGQASDWENPVAVFDVTQAVGLSPSATELRIATEELVTELAVQRPVLIGGGGEARYAESLHYAAMARWLLNYHAGVARQAGPAYLLGMRDAAMADNLAYMAARERGRGKVLAFAHNSHLRRGMAEWELGGNLLTWWPAGAHLNAMFGAAYAVIGSAVGVSEANGIGRPETGTLEARLMAAPGRRGSSGRFIATHKGRGLPAEEIATLPTRSGSVKNTSYFALASQSLSDFDWLVVLDSTTYSRGGPPLSG